LGCSDERFDSIAVYTNALAYYITSGTQYSKKAIEYMNAWSPVVKTHGGPNGLLQPELSRTCSGMYIIHQLKEARSMMGIKN
jgi:hypothetical protein